MTTVADTLKTMFQESSEQSMYSTPEDVLVLVQASWKSVTNNTTIRLYPPIRDKSELRQSEPTIYYIPDDEPEDNSDSEVERREIAFEKVFIVEMSGNIGNKHTFWLTMAYDESSDTLFIRKARKY